MKSCVRPLAALLLAASLLSGCKEPPPPPPPPAPVDTTPKPTTEFPDGVLQGEYEAAWQRFLVQFQPPEVGDYLWLQRANGILAGGEIKEWTPDAVTLKDGTNETTVARAEIAESSLHEVYADAFARKHALDEVNASFSFNISALTGSVFVGTQRYSVSETLQPRAGPGARFAAVPAGDLGRGALLDVVEENGLWIKVRPQGRADTFWIEKLATSPSPGTPPENAALIIQQLLISGYLSSYLPEQSEARMSRAVWAGTHPGVREGLSRMLAAHSARVRKASAEWIEIKDADTGRRLARYSQSQGFRSQ